MRVELFIVLFHLLAFVVLMRGLFPFSSSSKEIANRSCFDGQGLCESLTNPLIAFDPLEASHDHVIVMIIDALRADYVFNRSQPYHLRSIEKLKHDGQALSVKLRSHSPTVTLPRLKVRKTILRVRQKGTRK